MPETLVKYPPEHVKAIVAAIKSSVYTCSICKKEIYPSMEIYEDGTIGMDVYLSELRAGIGNSIEAGNVCLDCARKRGNIVTEKISSMSVSPQDAEKYLKRRDEL